MKADIDRLMSKRGLDAIIVTGGEGHNTPRTYMSNGAHITGGIIVKKQGDDPILFVNGMEVEEAAKSGLAVFTYYDLDWAALLQEYEGDRSKVLPAMLVKALQKAGVPRGKVGLYGNGDLNVYLEVVRRLERHFPQYEILGEMGFTLFDEAYVTKDDAELARIKSVAQRTSEVVRLAWDFISSHREAEGVVVNADGQPLTIGAVKSYIRAELNVRGLQDTGMIFAQGRDGGYPHSRGENDQPLRTGQAIVFDLSPHELGGGYHHDMTRTWSIGYATEAVQQAYEDVMEAFDQSIEAFAVNKPTYLAQEAALDSLEGKGHPTTRTDPSTMTGYVHSLGHGVGLNIHERPSMSHLLKEDIFQIGNVITIEPGVYYPDDGYGMRVEDTFYVSESGELISITDVPKDLVLPLNG